MSLLEQMRSEDFAPENFSALLENSSHEESLNWSRSLKQNELQKLYDAYDKVNKISMESLLPVEHPAFENVEHFGYNNLPNDFCSI